MERHPAQNSQIFQNSPTLRPVGEVRSSTPGEAFGAEDGGKGAQNRREAGGGRPELESGVARKRMKRLRNNRADKDDRYSCPYSRLGDFSSKDRAVYSR